MTGHTSLAQKMRFRIAALFVALGVLLPIGAAVAVPTMTVGAMKTHCIVLDEEEFYLDTGIHSIYGGTACWRS